MTASDALHFNITLLLPRNSTISSTLVIPQLLCHLPNFQHVYQQMDPYVTFGSIILGGALSGVAIEVRGIRDPISVLVLNWTSQYKHPKPS